MQRSTFKPHEESLSLSELDDKWGHVLRAVGEGQSFVVTERGKPVARILPIDAEPPRLPGVRPATRTGGWGALEIRRKRVERRLTATLDDRGSDRV